ncbi:G-type lectin S-receptor-like serine/threonine-protein kinase [Senna tora]|uniref:Receptor-like serine/threonine-protein kinase n=1 Tax=Senna tora TaxID=362788 RepID=A0A834WGR9_9FABA|nr:G-type lectin S-receptor-like serine/threonine-protein kinase [Senna tora]
MDLLPLLNLLASFLLLLPIPKPSTAATSLQIQSLRPSQFITDDGTTTLVSKAGTFAFGFFSPATSNKRYLGIWYNKIPDQTVVWVANRLNPILNHSSVSALLTINTTTGNLVLSQNDTVLWHTNSTTQPQSPLVQLLDSGNLVLLDEKNESNPEAYLWQSFDFPSDTLLPGMKFGWDLRIGLNRVLTAWKSPDDPSPGDFTSLVVLNNYPDSYLMKGTEKFYRFGPWNGLHASGSPEVKSNPVFDYSFVNNKDEFYYTFSLKNNSVFTRLVMNQTNSARYRYVWVENDKKWTIYSTKPVDYCDNYGLCGPNGNCVINDSPVCQCLRGFTPKSPQHWNSVDWSDGCVRNKALNCSEKLKDGFVKFEGMKVPDTTHTWLDVSMNLEQCRDKCLSNCSCMAYTNSDVRGTGSGCVLWFGDLIDMRQYGSGGQDLYIRMTASELDAESGGGSKKKLIVIITITIAVILGMFLVGCFCICRNKTGKITLLSSFSPNALEKSEDVKVLIPSNERSKNDLDLPLFDLLTIASATDDFSEKNKIGQDDTKGNQLDWSTRFQIILGIGRGLMYLHQDSRLRIIHRDLKASNILLDDKFIPKISDFGLAKTFGEEQTEGNTNRVVGTYGYMAPEYAADGLYSVKSDVFSYGILVLEIICGKKNRGFYFEDYKHNLIGHAWILWKEGMVLELVDKKIEETWNVSEMLRCIQVGLLCVQENQDDRPTIASAVLMMESDITLAEPKQPVVNMLAVQDASNLVEKNGIEKGKRLIFGLLGN